MFPDAEAVAAGLFRHHQSAERVILFGAEVDVMSELDARWFWVSLPHNAFQYLTCRNRVVRKHGDWFSASSVGNPRNEQVFFIWQY